MNHRNNTLALVLSTLFASTGFAQTAQSGPATQPNGGATQTQPVAPTFNPNSNPNPNPASPVGNPPTPIANPAGSPATNPGGPAATNPGGPAATNPGGPPATNPAGGPATNPGAAVNPVSGSTTMQTPGSTASTTQVFTSLDPARKGYLSTADVASNKFLASNFQHCDTNADGRLTQGEVTLCMQSVPPGAQ